MSPGRSGRWASRGREDSRPGNVAVRATADKQSGFEERFFHRIDWAVGLVEVGAKRAIDE